MRKLTLLLIVLMLASIPLASAVSITAQGQGADKISGFVKESDDITITARILGYPNPAANQVSISGSGAAKLFDSCVGDTCTVKLSNQVFSQASTSYTITFLPTTEKQTISLKLDRVGASVESIQITPQVVSPTGTITLNAELLDIAYTTQGTCVGLKEVQVLVGSSKKKVIPLNGACSQSLSTQLLVSDLSSKEGTNVVALNVIDKFNNEATNQKTASFIIDKTPPTLSEKEFSIIRNDEEVLAYATPISVEVSFGKPVDAVSVSADLSALNPSLGVELFSCDLICSKTITLNLGTIKEGNEKLRIKVTAADELGNSATFNLDKSLLVDKTGPEVDEISGLPSINDRLIIGKQKTFSVELDDKSIINPSGVRFRADAVNAVASSCEENVCKITPTFNVGGDVSASITASDALGNAALAFTFPLRIDVVAPRIINIDQSFEDIELVFEQGALSRGSSGSTGIITSPTGNINISAYPTQGDSIVFVAQIEESTAAMGYGNFSAINEEEIFLADCEGGVDVDNWRVTLPNGEEERINVDEGPNPIVCVFEVEITKPGHIIDGKVPLTFEDPAGNKVTQVVNLPLIYGISNAAPNYWTHTTTCSPSALDRSLGELIEQSMFCSIKLTPTTQIPSNIAHIEIDKCRGDYLEDARVGNTQSTTPYLELTFEQDEYETNGFNVTCTLEITSIAGNIINTIPEVETVNIPISLFNNPLGTPDDAVVDKIEDIRQTWGEDFGQVIGVLDGIMQISTSLCKAANSVQQVAKVLDISASIIPDPQGLAPRGAGEVTSVAADTQKGLFERFCAFVNCRPIEGDEGWTNILSGGAFSGVKDSLVNLPGTELITKAGGNPEEYLDVKNNIYLSTVTMCIPGIIQGLNEYRQIQCFYGYCLQDLTVEAGIPADACESQHAYQTCKYFVSPLFRLHPLVNFVDTWLSMIKQAISDPFAAIGVLANLQCNTTEQIGWTACRLVHVVNVATDAYENVVNIFDQFETFGEDYCSELDSSPRRRSGGLSRGV